MKVFNQIIECGSNDIDKLICDYQFTTLEIIDWWNFNNHLTDKFINLGVNRFINKI